MIAGDAQTSGDDLYRDQGRGLQPRKSSRTPPQEVNGRVSYFLHERFFCFALQDRSFLDATKPLG